MKGRTFFRYYAAYKPYEVLCRFSPQEGKRVLADIFSVEKDVYPVGRLDYDSEGLLLLTNDKQLNERLLHPRHGHEREYLVQVDGNITDEAMGKLKSGLTISAGGKKYETLPCHVRRLSEAPAVPERNPPIRFRKNIPVSWISLVMREGKNRQVRKMTAAVGFPTLRLIRYRIGKLRLDELMPGDIRAWNREAFYAALFEQEG